MSSEYWNQWDKEDLDAMHGIEKAEIHDLLMEMDLELDEDDYRCAKCTGCYYCLAVI